jgi:hypothetical protein
MNSSEKYCRAYYPWALQTMGRAFDTAVDALPADYERQQEARRELALVIIRSFDEGITNPAHLCKIALNMCELTNRSISGSEKARSGISIFTSQHEGKTIPLVA